MILTFDIGNTTTMAGIFEAEKLTGFGRIVLNIETGLAATTDEIGIKVDRFLQIYNKKGVQIEGIAICSVAPDFTALYCEMTEKYLNCKPWILDHRADLGLKIAVDQPKQVGPDRLANAIAAKTIYGSPSIVVDLGTATTFDVIDAKGDYIGGAIAPGVQTSSAELFRKAARLFPVELEKPPKYIGANTADAMKSGIFYGTLGMIDYMVSKIIGELGEDGVKVIATGGYAEKFAPYSEYIQESDAALTLRGIMLAYERNR
jgi:type III pantothenate kinase